MSTQPEQLPEKPKFDYAVDDKGRPLPGVYDGLDEQQYRKAWAVANSDLLAVEKSPLKYKFNQANPKPSTPAMLFGTALHCLVLEPDKFLETYVVDKFPGSRSKEAVAWRAEQVLAGKIIIDNKIDDSKNIWGMSDWDKLHRMRDACLGHEILGILLQDFRPEVSIFWKEPNTGFMCKCRVDALPNDHDIALDLKTTVDASYTEFMQSIGKWGYHHQAAHYADGLNAAGFTTYNKEFLFAAVEKEPPFEIGIYYVGKDDFFKGYNRRMHNLEKFKECVLNNDWPGIPTEPREITLAPWHHKINIL